MIIAPPNTPLSLEVTYDSPALYVGLSVFDVTDLTPVQVGDVIPMTYVGLNTYTGKFTGSLGHNYVAAMAVYTDDDYDTIDNSYSNGSESIVVRESGGGGGSSAEPCELVGVIEGNPTLIGVIVNPGALVGVVVC